MAGVGRTMCVIGAVVLGSCSGADDSGSASAPTTVQVDPRPVDGERIAYTTESLGVATVFVMGVDDPPGEAIMDNPGREAAPDWSPDGRRIAFQSSRDGTTDLYIYDLQSGRVDQLFDDVADDHCPIWSPDGRRLAFVSDRSGDEELWVANADDGARLTKLSHGIQVGCFMAWSPDGDTIAVVGTRDGDEDRQTYLLEVESGTLTGVTAITGNEVVGDFLADGTSLVVAEANDAGTDLLVVDTVRDRIVQTVTTPRLREGKPSVAPDGHRVVVPAASTASAERRPHTDLYIIDLLGEPPERLTRDGTAGVPDWSPAAAGR